MSVGTLLVRRDGKGEPTLHGYMFQRNYDDDGDDDDYDDDDVDKLKPVQKYAKYVSPEAPN